MIRRMAVSILVLAAIAVGADEAARTYLKGTITGFETRLHDKNRRTKVYELKGADRIYQVDICGSLQAGKYAPGQQVEYRVAGNRLYIRRDDNPAKEYNCQIEGSRTLDSGKTETSTPR